jgi:hypothetical protein
MAAAAAADGFWMDTTTKHEALIHDRRCESQFSVVCDIIIVAFFTNTRSLAHTCIR